MLRSDELAYYPTDWPFQLQKRDGYYELRAVYHVDGTNKSEFKIPEAFVRRNGNQSVLLSQKDLELIPDSHWRLPIDPRVYLVHPQPLNLNDTIHRLLNSTPIAEVRAPINGDTFRYVAISQGVCHPENPQSHTFDIVVVVKSNVAGFKRREVFRRVYGGVVNANSHPILNMRIGLVFSLGVPRTQANSFFRRGSLNFKLNGSGSENLNPKSLRQISKKLAEELATHDDMIVGDYEDTYYNLTMKTHHSYMWFSTFCRIAQPSVLFIDDDVPFSPQQLVQVLSSMSQEQRRTLFHGKVEKNAPVIRFGWKTYQKWALLKEEAPWPLYPPYLQGIYILAGFQHVERLALGMLFTRYIPIEDAWIGLVATKLNIPLNNIHEYMTRESMVIKKRSEFEPVDIKIFYR
ncbi:Lactosylceramide 13-N-acetyl-beta-D-glucosaminyltransferase [Taenia solium]